MSKLIISVSGLRGIVGETLTPEVALRYAAAFSETLADEGMFVITRDSRPSGEMLASIIEGAILATGRDTFDAGVAATPTTGVLIRQLDAAGGLQISASHNPSEYNGIKLLNREGRVIPAAQGAKVLERYHESTTDWRSHDKIGLPFECTDAISDHLDAVLALVDVDRIRERRFKVLLDVNGGAGGLLGRPLLEALGCDMVMLGEMPDGRFHHPAEPTAENLQDVTASIVRTKADIGFCQDPDADRLAIIDATGRYIGEEYTVALCGEHILSRTPGPVVINCASSRMMEDIATKYGVTCHRSPVGEANVVDLMRETGAIFGGEGNGGPIHPRVGLIRDSFVGMALVLDMMAAREKPVAELADALPRYEIVKMKAPLEKEKLSASLDRLEKEFADAQADRSDGLRLVWPDRWLLLRGSNTEPIVRAIAEAPTNEEATALCEKALAMLGK